MRKLKSVLWGAGLVAVWLLSSSDVAPYSYRGWTPYFMKRAELEKSVRAAEAREMVNPGKIWIEGNTIYVVERYKGVHTIDNTDPKNPKTTGFLVAPGCMDIAVKGSVIYLDNAIDLVAWDTASGAVTARLKNYFPQPASPAGDRYYGDPDQGMILVGWKQIVEEEGRP
jgi:hypothetical protein